eukprot:m.150280 g.150280  ORF g.150280 m.150280 type:complete len:98 (-) comp17826_c1_seq11:1585-1878(-)
MTIKFLSVSTLPSARICTPVLQVSRCTASNLRCDVTWVTFFIVEGIDHQDYASWQKGIFETMRQEQYVSHRPFCLELSSSPHLKSNKLQYFFSRELG